MKRGAAVAFLAVLFAGALAAPASASTFCVPGFFAACPDNGTNQARADLNVAMSEDGGDGTPDKVMIDSGTLTATESFLATGSDPLEVVGSGRDKTFLTSSSSSNIFLLRTDDRPGIKISDLTLEVPASFPDSGGNGSAAQIEDAELTRVDVWVRNSESDGIDSMIGNNVIKDSHVYAAEGSKVGWAFVANGAHAGKTTITGAQVDQPDYGFVADDPKTTIEVHSSRVIDPSGSGAWAGSGGRISLENSLILTHGNSALEAISQSGKSGTTLISAVSSTLVNVGTSDYPAIYIRIPSSTTAGNGAVVVGSSIIRGYDATWNMEVPIGPGYPSATLSIGYSNFPPVAAEGSGGRANVDSPTNIDQDPLFVSPQDFRLSPGSPSIDTGDPSSAITTDLDGAPRPRDGDGNGSSFIDQGAFEFQPSCSTVSAFCPKLSKVKFRFRKGKGGSLRFRLSQPATIKATFTPVPKKAKRKRKTVKITRQAKQGPVKIKLRKNRLERGRYKLKVVAIDKAGFQSKPVIKTVRVR